MADTVRLARDLADDGDRVIVLGHNGHLQRVPFTFLPGVTAPSAGTYLAEELGEDYVVIAMTAVAGATTGLALDDTKPHSSMDSHGFLRGGPDLSDSTATLAS